MIYTDNCLALDLSISLKQPVSSFRHQFFMPFLEARLGRCWISNIYLQLS